MKKIALVTCTKHPQLTDDDRLLVPELLASGLQPVVVLWDDSHVDWSSFSAVVLRSPWDYVLKYQGFRNWLGDLQRKKIPLWNPAEIVLWNLDKRYLEELNRAHIPIIPTEVIPRHSTRSLKDILDASQTNEAVVKPAVSAGAFRTWRVSRENSESKEKDFQKILKSCACLVQPYYAEIESSGEWSLFFFGTTYSHAVQKIPPQGEFVAHPRFGAVIKAATPPDFVLESALRIMEFIKTPLLYARIDGLVVEDKFLLMELELAEPNLYFEYNKSAAKHFVERLLELI